VGVGLTVTVATIAAPTHELAKGVIVYVAVPGLPAVVVNVCAIFEPEAAVAPLTPV
jgi:hypothetical protein